MYFYLIAPAFAQEGIDTTLSVYLARLFIGVTVLIAASGYLINDYFDLEIDKINKPSPFVLSKKELVWLYILLASIGFVLSIYIAIQIGNIPLVIIYPIAVATLFVYSKNLKYRGFIGNVIVAGFTSFVPWIVIIAEPELLHSPNDTITFVCKLIFAFGLFSFFINLMREIVKDIEDKDGDERMQSKSLPITIGIAKAKVVVYFNAVVLIILVILWTFNVKEIQTFRLMVFNSIFIVAPIIRSILQLHKAALKTDYHNVSTIYKWIMMSGLISLIMVIQEILT